jgi:hypothetical protein
VVGRAAAAMAAGRALWQQASASLCLHGQTMGGRRPACHQVCREGAGVTHWVCVVCEVTGAATIQTWLSVCMPHALHM